MRIYLNDVILAFNKFSRFYLYIKLLLKIKYTRQKTFLVIHITKKVLLCQSSLHCFWTPSCDQHILNCIQFKIHCNTNITAETLKTKVQALSAGIVNPLPNTMHENEPLIIYDDTWAYICLLIFIK